MATAAVASLAEGFGFPLDVSALRSGGRMMQVGGTLSAHHLLQPEPLERL